MLDSSAPTLDLVDQLLVEDVQARRAAAHRLAEMAAEQQPLDDSTVDQLADVAMAETDALVWRDLLRSVKDKASPAAVRMASVGVSHASADVRRLSCGYLAMHSDPAHAVVLYRLLDDPNRAVVLAAIDALCVPGMVTDPAPLERLLGSDDGVLRVATAHALAVNGYATGAAVLARFAGDANLETRRLAVTALGQLREVAYIDVLVGHLDDELSVRLASVASLAQIVGRDVTLADAPLRRHWPTRSQAGKNGGPSNRSRRCNRCRRAPRRSAASGLSHISREVWVPWPRPPCPADFANNWQHAHPSREAFREFFLR